MKYLPYKDKKAFATDLKGIYGAINETAGIEALMELRERWESK